MKNFLLFFLAMVLTTPIFSQRNCGSMDYLQSQIEKNPDRLKSLQKIEDFTQDWIKNHKQNGTRAIVTIPVVVHVVYRTATENISDAQIQSQLTVLTDDFRRLNADANNNWSQAADTEIEFCLANVDPSGNATSGITRTSTTVNGFGTNDKVKFNAQGGKDAWPASDYLNLWVCKIGGGILGYAQFPGGPANTDGVVIDYRYFGTIGTATAPFDLGRTATHEVGHWLNLRHIWGDGGCGVDDFVSDTPKSDAANYGCATGHVSCGTTDMVENYMDYSDDACMNLYTLGQKNRMQALFGAGGARASLLNSSGCSGNGGGGNGGGCTDNAVQVNLNFDNYPEETSWTITNSSGSVVASGGTYGGQADGSSLTIDVCLVDGCYDFTINDAYGDGMCCSYGSGSYTVTGGGTTYASGGSFGSSETTNFCVGGGQAPTCNDGIQNGDETGVDCGGSSCAPCPTCNDGIQNGDETGVDCGGSNCAPCGGGSNTTQLLASYFETGWDGWYDGGYDCYRYTGSKSWEGSKSIRIRDNSGTKSAMTTGAFDLTGYSDIEITFYFYPNSMEYGEDFWVRFKNNSGWHTVAAYASGTSFNNGSFYMATVNISAVDYPFASNSKFRIQCDASSNADQIYIDEVIITASGGGNRMAQKPRQTIKKLYGLDDNAKYAGSEDMDFEAFPNPATDDLTILAPEKINQVDILSITGQVMISKKSNKNEINMDVSTLNSGIYIITLKTEEEVMSRKFVKQ